MSIVTSMRIAVVMALVTASVGAVWAQTSGVPRTGTVEHIEEDEGDHTNRIGDRVETKVLPFFSDALSFSTKGSSSTRH